jgi:hypothetical protein
VVGGTGFAAIGCMKPSRATSWVGGIVTAALAACGGQTQGDGVGSGRPGGSGSGGSSGSSGVVSVGGSIASSGSSFGSTSVSCASITCGCPLGQTPTLVNVPGGCPTCGCEGTSLPAGSCPQSLSSYCTNAGDCRGPWSAVVASSPCGADSLGPCGGYNVLLVRNVDTSQRFVYDPNSGDLVAVLFDDANRGTQTCLGGPPTFPVPLPQCIFPWVACDAGASDASRE